MKLPARVGDYVVRRESYISAANHRIVWFEVWSIRDHQAPAIRLGKYRTLEDACDAAIAASSLVSQRAYPASEVDGYVRPEHRGNPDFDPRR